MGTDRVIDLMVISHTDSDHVGAVPAILDEFEVRTVLRTGLIRCNPGATCRWRASNDATRDKVFEGKTIDLNLRRSPISLGYTFKFDEVSVQIVSGFHVPPSGWGLPNDSAEFRNAGSIVIRLEYDGKSILFTGDEFGKDPGLNSPMEAAEQLMVDNQADRPIQSDVLIAAHHGADNGSSTDFLKAVSSTFVIFPAGGSHQHPRQNTVTRMTDPQVGILEANLFRTDQCDDPGPAEWPGAHVPGADDDFGDDEIDIVLTKGSPDVAVGYVNSALTCSP
jgi:competence protein ComEC